MDKQNVINTTEHIQFNPKNENNSATCCNMDDLEDAGERTHHKKTNMVSIYLYEMPSIGKFRET